MQGNAHRSLDLVDHRMGDLPRELVPSTLPWTTRRSMKSLKYDRFIEKLRKRSKINFEGGYGKYSYLLTALTGFVVVSFCCIVYSPTILVPTSACELKTTSAQQGFMAAAPLVGTIVGGMLWGYLGDTRGRKNTMMITLFLSAVTNALMSLSVNWIMFMTLHFIAAFLVSGNFSLAMTLLSESVPMVKRNVVMLQVSSIYVLAQGLMSVLAIPMIPLTFSYYLPALDIYWNSWRTLVIIYSIPNLLSMCWLSLMKESPKFVFLKGREQEAINILKFVHRMNNSKDKELDIHGLQKEQNSVDTALSRRDQILPLFKRPFIKFTVLLCLLNLFQLVGPFVIWLPTIVNNFIVILETGEAMDLTLCGVIGLDVETTVDPDATPCALNETALLIVLGVGVMQSITNAIIGIIVNKVSRRNMVMVTTSVCGLCGILVNLIPNAIASIIFFGISLLGVLVIGLYTAIVVALFPTHLRAMAVAVTATGNQVGSFVSVQILNLMLANHCDLGFYLFSGIFASSALLAAFLPDDRRLARSAPPQKKEIEISKL
ncbi:synaptic vesicle 2-related protein-like [Aphomia sociella]